MKVDSVLLLSRFEVGINDIGFKKREPIERSDRPNKLKSSENR